MNTFLKFSKISSRRILFLSFSSQKIVHENSASFFTDLRKHTRMLARKTARYCLFVFTYHARATFDQSCIKRARIRPSQLRAQPVKPSRSRASDSIIAKTLTDVSRHANSTDRISGTAQHVRIGRRSAWRAAASRDQLTF